MLVPERTQPRSLSRTPAAILGCLLGGAVGDALGAPVEFLAWEQIRQQFGECGIVDFVPAYGQLGAITDDTQMMLFTAEGLLRAHVRGLARGICHPPGVIHHTCCAGCSPRASGPPPR